VIGNAPNPNTIATVENLVSSIILSVSIRSPPEGVSVLCQQGELFALSIVV